MSTKRQLRTLTRRERRRLRARQQQRSLLITVPPPAPDKRGPASDGLPIPRMDVFDVATQADDWPSGHPSPREIYRSDDLCERDLMLLMEVGGGLSPFEMCEGDACHDLAVRPAPWVGEFSVRMSALYSDSADTCKERITVLIQAYSLALFDVRSDLGLH